MTLHIFFVLLFPFKTIDLQNSPNLSGTKSPNAYACLKRALSVPYACLNCLGTKMGNFIFTRNPKREISYSRNQK